MLQEDFPDRHLTVTDLKTWHHRWLGNVYDWAGRERAVNLGKDGFQFAAATQVPRLLEAFERDCLARFTPCHLDEAAAIEAIAVTHVEFILIHPFREGNGRLSRLLADVMVTQAGHGPLDYSAWDAGKADYIAAIHAGLAGDYVPMRGWVERGPECRGCPERTGCQWASDRSRYLPCFTCSLRSMRAIGWPVSMAVELATARTIAACEGLLVLRFSADGRGAFMHMIILLDRAGRPHRRGNGARKIEKNRRQSEVPRVSRCATRPLAAATRCELPSLSNRISVGLAVAGADSGCDPEAPIQRADLALYAAKDAGWSRVVVGDAVPRATEPTSVGG